MNVRVYGLKNCDTCRKALRWLDAQGISYHFVEVRDAALGPQRITAWLQQLGTDALVNRRSTTWRSLDAAQQACADNPATAASLLDEHRSLIRRPVLESDNRVVCGFDVDCWSELLAGIHADG